MLETDRGSLAATSLSARLRHFGQAAGNKLANNCAMIVLKFAQIENKMKVTDACESKGWNGKEEDRRLFMKKKMVTVIVVILIVILLFFAGWYVLYCYAGVGPAFPFMPIRELGQIEQLTDDVEGEEAAVESQLMALAESEEEAKEIAELYGIELVSFAEGVAVYETTENPQDVINRGTENGYPQVYINYERQLYSE